MTIEGIIRMAKQAGFYIQDDEWPTNRQDFDLTKHLEHDLTKCLERFAKLVAEQEREACAKVCETHGVHPALNVWNGGPDWYKHGKDCAETIRARG